MLGALAMGAETYKTEKGISYRPDATDAYQKERCKLDFYYPARGEAKEAEGSSFGGVLRI